MKKSFFRMNFVLKKKKLWFSSLKGVPNYIFWRNMIVLRLKRRIPMILLYAHTVVLRTWSHFFCTTWVILRLQKTMLRIHFTIKGKKIKYKKPPHEKIRKTQNESTGSSKNGENHILRRNSDFQKSTEFSSSRCSTLVQTHVGNSISCLWVFRKSL